LEGKTLLLALDGARRASASDTGTPRRGLSIPDSLEQSSVLHGEEEDPTNVVERAKVSSRCSNQQMKCREENLEDPTDNISIDSEWKYTLDDTA
jgi:hypothetical protein